MEIEAPPQAIALWSQGNRWLIRFPDQQLVEIPAGAVNRLNSILIARETAAARATRSRVATPGAPIQEILDAWRERDDPGFQRETLEERIRNAGARQRAADEARKAKDAKRKERIAREREKIAAAEELLMEIGL